jgi:MYXO-CTERM domain-containing protein
MVAVVVAAALLTPRAARACGCFAPPTPAVPVVQAGERILFLVEDGMVTAHVQISYQGNTAGGGGEFGWIVPVPSVPTLELGTDELFTQLEAATQPTYVRANVQCGQRLSSLGCFTDAQCTTGQVCDQGAGVCVGTDLPDGTVDVGGDCLTDADCLSGDACDPSTGLCIAGAADASAPTYQPLVLQASVGPFDYAVLHADRKQEMLDWLMQNHYFVPSGVGDVIAPYVRPGGYFLALKLRSGEPAGDLQPIVLRYASDLPMIPIVLTQVAAKPDMGIEVFVLGPSRAIPRNYYHTVLNDSQLHWLEQDLGYNDLVIRASHEAPDRHTFVTEFAGASSLMHGVLDFPGRFGSQDELASQPDPINFVSYLFSSGFVLSSQLTSLLGEYLPVPPVLARQGVDPTSFYANIASYLGAYGPIAPGTLDGWNPDYRPADMAAQIFMRIVEPTRAAARLFDEQLYLTRLYTTLSPQDMTVDPVFSLDFDHALPDVSNEHAALLLLHCNDAQSGVVTGGTLVTESGWEIDYPADVVQGMGTAAIPNGPASWRIETLREEGGAVVVTDNTAAIRLRRDPAEAPPALPPGPAPTPPSVQPFTPITPATTGVAIASHGCSAAPGTPGDAGPAAALVVVVVLLAGQRRRDRQRQGFGTQTPAVETGTP